MMTTTATLPIVSVQELVKEHMSEVPDSYVCVDKPQPVITCDGREMSTTFPATDLPIISMKHLLSEDQNLSAIELHKLHSACKDWGFFQLASHGISSEKLRHEIEEFFKLPLEEKLKYGVRPGDFEGYGPPNAVTSESKLDWADRFFMIINPLTRRKPHLLPQLPSFLRETMETYIQEMQSTAMQLLVLVSKCLGIDMKEMKDLFGGEDGLQTLRMTYYPPCSRPELVLGLTPHSDGSAITILNQINGVDGLQIKKDGAWIPVSIAADAFVVNLGDVMEKGKKESGLVMTVESREEGESERPKSEKKIGVALPPNAPASSHVYSDLESNNDDGI